MEHVVHFLNLANYTVSCDKAHAVQNIKNFLCRSINYLGITDANRNRKNGRIQIAMFNTILSISSYVINARILFMVEVLIVLIKLLISPQINLL